MFWELLKESVIIQGLVTLLFTIAIVAMLLLRMPVPTELWAAYGVVLGYWFGTKNTYVASKTAKEVENAIKEAKDG